MSALLKSYLALEAEFKANPAKTTDELKRKSQELNKKQAALLSQMSEADLNRLLGQTSGPMRSVIGDNLRKLRESEFAAANELNYG